jgi:hypothetical protein
MAKPGKYEAVVSNLPDVPVENPKAQERINAFKEKIRAEQVHTPESLAKAYAQLREGTGNPIDADFTNTLIELLGDDGITELKSECDKRMAAYEQMLTESHDHDEPGWGMYGASDHTVKLSDGSAVDVLREPTGKVKDKEAFRQWCIANGLETSLQLWPSTANSIVKERCVNGQPAPDGIEIYALVKVKYRRARE